jgi:ribonuclease P protein component
LTKHYKFKKEERLKSPAEINDLFTNCRSVLCNPLKVIYKVTPCSSRENEHETGKTPYPLQVLITVSSRKFRNAVDRNRIRRKIREAYRLNKHSINAENENHVNLKLGIIYIGENKDPDYSVIESALLECIVKLRKQVRFYRQEG